MIPSYIKTIPALSIDDEDFTTKEYAIYLIGWDHISLGGQTWKVMCRVNVSHAGWLEWGSNLRYRARYSPLRLVWRSDSPKINGSPSHSPHFRQIVSFYWTSMTGTHWNCGIFLCNVYDTPYGFSRFQPIAIFAEMCLSFFRSVTISTGDSSGFINLVEWNS